MVEAYEYDAYGKHVIITDGDDGDSVVNFGANDVRTAMGVSAAGVGNLFAFTGREYDGESGMHCFRQRYIDSRQGRAISADPIWPDDGFNAYVYARSNPMEFSDAFGEASDAPQWHHLLPQQWTKQFMQAGIDNSSKEYGLILSGDCHVGSEGLHPEWNKEWKNFFDKFGTSKPNKQQGFRST